MPLNQPAPDALEDRPQLSALGDCAVLLSFGSTIAADLNARVQAAAHALRASSIAGVCEIVPAYASIAVHYDPGVFGGAGASPYANVCRTLLGVLDTGVSVGSDVVASLRRIEIAVHYGGDAGPDLAALAAHAGLTPAAVIALHCSVVYRVAMLGFAAGFPYLIGLPAALQMPRRAVPRTRVDAGSIGIGGAQTGIYPRALPGGWQLIGRTAQVLFDPHRDPPSLLAPGDEVRFVPITVDDAERVEQGA